MKLFCPHCGTRNEKNDSPTLDKQIVFDCPDCNLSVVLTAMHYPDKTVEECIKMFDDTPLTESQSGIHKRKAKKRRK